MISFHRFEATKRVHFSDTKKVLPKSNSCRSLNQSLCDPFHPPNMYILSLQTTAVCVDLGINSPLSDEYIEYSFNKKSLPLATRMLVWNSIGLFQSSALYPLQSNPPFGQKLQKWNRATKLRESIGCRHSAHMYVQFCRDSSLLFAKFSFLFEDKHREERMNITQVKNPKFSSDGSNFLVSFTLHVS